MTVFCSGLPVAVALTMKPHVLDWSGCGCCASPDSPGDGHHDRCCQERRNHSNGCRDTGRFGAVDVTVVTTGWWLQHH